MPETALEPVQKPIRDHSRLTRAEQALAFKLADDGQTQTFIAQQIGCNQSSISELLSAFADTRPRAKRLANNAAEKLTKRVIDDADVDQCLEVLDRIGVLEKRQTESGKGNNVMIVMGRPGQPAGLDPFNGQQVVVDVDVTE